MVYLTIPEVTIKRDYA